jgi:exodeoxyribonuclease-3
MHGLLPCAEKKGYSGVGLWSDGRRIASSRASTVASSMPKALHARRFRQSVGDFALSALRFFVARAPGSQVPLSRRFLSPSASLARRRAGDRVVLCGDWNIAHQEIDLKNWKSNQKNSGFLPEERAWLSRVFDELGWVDVYRRLHPEATDECYTWWSNRGQAWAKNVGWRIDYQIATPGLRARRGAPKSTRASAFPITRRWSSITNGQ